MAKTHRPCVSVILRNPDGKVLLVRKPRDRDAWQLPQGGIDDGESIGEAAHRELLEETGIGVDASSFTQCGQTYRYDYPPDFIETHKPQYDGQQLTFIAASVPHDTVVNIDQRELDDFAWVRPEELRKYLERDGYRRIIETTLTIEFEN